MAVSFDPTSLREMRLAQRLTQRQLADRAGISLEGVWTIENGRKSPRRSTVERLATALGVRLAELAAPHQGRLSHLQRHDPVATADADYLRPAG